MLNRRAERQDQTRERIVDAALELHHTIGPARTTDLAIAERAGVTRRTFYRHFPDELSLFRACTSHAFEKLPPPDPDSWRRVADPTARLRVALRELYAYYEVAGAGLAVIMRDRALLPAEVQALPGRADRLGAMPSALLEPWRAARGRSRKVLAAALVHATAVTTWESLVMQQHLTSAEAVELLVALVKAAANAGAGPSGRGPIMRSPHARTPARSEPGPPPRQG